MFACHLLVVIGLAIAAAPHLARADGKVLAPRNYPGSLEERSQEAIIIFHGGSKPGEATEDLILKIAVQGLAGPGQLDRFAWVVPLPSVPTTAKEDPKVFQELFDYVESRQIRASSAGGVKAAAPALDARAERQAVEVLSRQIVGSYEVAVVRENQPGALNDWLDVEGYQSLPGGDDVIGFYRDKNYVFACVKVSNAAITAGRRVELHPLRFTFNTGGRDGIYFPMRMTGLQQEPFDVNLYVFYKAWLNDSLSKFGYTHRGFSLKYRDWDSPECVANAGKTWSSPADDAFLRGHAFALPTTTALFQKLHPGGRFYLTNIQATNLKPADVRHWTDDLWLFPYYTNTSFVPFDARPGGPAAAAWPGEAGRFDDPAGGVHGTESGSPVDWARLIFYSVLLLTGMAVVLWQWRPRGRAAWLRK